MGKAIWGVLGLLIIIVLGAFFVSRNQTTAPTVPTATENPSTSPASTDSAALQTMNENVVTYSDSGFTPASINVKVGDTVTFKNDSSKSMWVASAPHPTHTGYSEFDAKKGYASGESYMFTFTKAGTWKYHDHLNPTMTGTVIVE
jgi:plastocyanin